MVLSEEDEDTAVDFERSVFLAGFTIRKLLEAGKLTDRVATADVKCSRYPLIDQARIPHRMNSHNFDRFYDLTRAKSGNAKLPFLSNQLIHSFVFVPIVAHGGGAPVEGLLVNSSFDRSRFLYQYELTEFIRVMRLVGNDEVLLSKGELDKNGEWITHNYGASDPEAK